MKKLLVLTWIAACGGPPQATTPALPPADPEPARPDTPPPPPPAVGKPRTDLIPRSMLFGNPERAHVQISPDGKHLSWLQPKDGVLNIWVAPVGKLDEARPITTSDKRPIVRYFWAYTNKHVLYLQDKDGDENFHVFRVDLATGEATDLTPHEGALASVLHIDPKRPNRLLVTINDRDPQLMDVHEVDLATGKRKLVVQNDEGFVGFTVDHDGNVRFAQKRTPAGATEIFQRTGTRWTLFETIGFEDAESTGIVGFVPGGKALYVTETRDRDTGALVQLDLETRKKTVLAEDPRADAGDLIVHPTKHTVQAVAFEYDRTRWQVLDRSIEKDLAALAKLDGGEVHITDRTLDDRTWIVVTTSEQAPARYYRWDRRTQKATFLFSLRPELEQHPLVKMWPVVIESRDGLGLVSYLSLPAAADPDGDGKPNTPVPMVLYVHGGPWARDSWGYEPLHQLLANRGYAVLSVNYRGSTGFGKKFLNAGNLEWGRKMHDDLIDAVEWAVKSGVAPRDKIGILGGSYGGYATLVGLTMTPDVFACGVDLVGISSLHTFIASIPPYWAPFLSVLKTRVGDPTTDEGKALLTERSPLTHAARIRRPLLIGQGANDPRVKQAESEQIVAAMQKLGLPATYALFPDEGHGFARPENNIAFFAITEAFLSAHLGGHYLPLTTEEIAASSMQIEVGKQGIPGLPN
jgi:dipeptidyl aminopeptidase/acylaminoacyl peptidase